MFHAPSITVLRSINYIVSATTKVLYVHDIDVGNRSTTEFPTQHRRGARVKGQVTRGSFPRITAFEGVGSEGGREGGEESRGASEEAERDQEVGFRHGYSFFAPHRCGVPQV